MTTPPPPAEKIETERLMKYRHRFAHQISECVGDDTKLTARDMLALIDAELSRRFSPDQPRAGCVEPQVPKSVAKRIAAQRGEPNPFDVPVASGVTEALRQDLIEAAEDVENYALDHYTGSTPKHIRRREYAKAQAGRLRALASSSERPLPRPQEAVAPASEGWRPIESAPKDGTVVLFCDEHGNRWADCSSAIDMWRYNGCGYPPKWWQPLPAAPSVVAGSEGEGK